MVTGEYTSNEYLAALESAFAPPQIPPQTIVIPRQDASSWQTKDSTYEYHVGTFEELCGKMNEPSWHNYVSDFGQMFNMLPSTYRNKTFIARLGDSVEQVGYPVLAKSRLIGDKATILLPLNRDRHFGEPYRMVVEGNVDHHFYDKIPQAFWRGSTTDHGWDPAVCPVENQRRRLVEKWTKVQHPYINVGLSGFVQELRTNKANSWRKYWQSFEKPFVPVPEQLQYRYLVCVEGNDVASSLKWMLASNSVVLMPPPRRESWFMESSFKAWVHFVPLRDDFEDLQDKVKFCESHLRLCKNIANEASKYARYFFNSSRSISQGAAILKRYLDNVDIRIEN